MGGRCALCIAVLSVGLGGCGRFGYEPVLGQQGSHDSLGGGGKELGDEDAGPSTRSGDGDASQANTGDGDTFPANPGEPAAADAGMDAPPVERPDAGAGNTPQSDAGVPGAPGAGFFNPGACTGWNSRYCGGGGWGGGGGFP
jgi:hypothetical protein